MDLRLDGWMDRQTMDTTGQDRTEQDIDSAQRITATGPSLITTFADLSNHTSRRQRN